MVVKLHFLDGLHTQHTSVGWMEHFSLDWVKQFQCFCHFKSYVYFAYLEHVWHIHGWNTWVFDAYIMRVHLTYWGGEILFISSVLFLIRHALRRSFVYVIHDLAFYTSCIFLSFDHEYFCVGDTFIPILHIFDVFLLSVLGNIIPFVNLWQKWGVKIGDMMEDSSNWFCHRIAKGGVCVSFCWRNLVSKMRIKCAAVRTRRKAVRTLKEFYFSREPCLQSCLQARLDELDKKKFLRASFAVSSELRLDTYVFLSDDLY